jgi:hypothetical protein
MDSDSIQGYYGPQRLKIPKENFVGSMCYWYDLLFDHYHSSGTHWLRGEAILFLLVASFPLGTCALL